MASLFHEVSPSILKVAKGIAWLPFDHLYGVEFVTARRVEMKPSAAVLFGLLPARWCASGSGGCEAKCEEACQLHGELG